MTVVIDASVAVAALIDTGPTGVWAESLLTRGALVAPHHMPVEVAAIVRRSALAGRITDDAGYVALAEALDAPLATLDARLSRADGPRCAFELPPRQA